ncbi:MAG: EamA family transporter RarD [Bacteriovoracia bacterium]
MNISSAHLAAITSFSMWGILPLYWKIFGNVGSWDLFGQRLIWSFISLILILLYKKKLTALKLIWKDKKIRKLLLFSGLMISSNWLLYIYAVNNNKVIEASMGYFLNPILNVLMGWLILKEGVRKTQWPAIILALLAIILLAFQTDLAHFPWVAIALAVTFALYGLVRKVAQIGSLEGLAFETSFVMIPVLIYWSFLETSPLTVYQLLPFWKIVVLSLSGLLTCIPLVLFAYGAKRLKLQTLGFIQYLSPSIKFICGLVILGEPLSTAKLHTFFIIWFALLWYTSESVYFLKKQKKVVKVSE